VCSPDRTLQGAHRKSAIAAVQVDVPVTLWAFDGPIACFSLADPHPSACETSTAIFDYSPWRMPPAGNARGEFDLIAVLVDSISNDLL